MFKENKNLYFPLRLKIIAPVLSLDNSSLGLTICQDGGIKLPPILLSTQMKYLMLRFR